MSELHDSASRVALRVANDIFTKFPIRAFIGIVLGIALRYFIRCLQDLFEWRNVVGDGLESYIGFCAIGLLIVFLRFLTSAWRQPLVWNEAVSDQIDLIERSNFSKEEKRQRFRQVCDAYQSQLNSGMRSGSVARESRPTRDERVIK